MIDAGSQVEVPLDEALQFLVGDLAGPERLDAQADRVGDPDAVGDLHLEPVGEAGRDDVLGDPAGGIRRGPVHLRRILAAEGAAAVAGHPAVAVDDDLAPGEAGVAHRAAGDEPAGRVDVHDRVRLAQLRGDGRQDDRFDDLRAQALDADVRIVLGGDDHGLDPDRDARCAYSIVTWVLPSGRRYGSWPVRRTSDRRRAMRWARAIGSGMSSGVSRQANPNIIPWSPAPSSNAGAASSRTSSAESTPWAMSGDCSLTDTSVPHVL